MAEFHHQGFSMPMFRNFVPEKLRPWLFVYLAFTFQLCSGVYLGCMEEMRGELSLKREDIMMCLYASLCGLGMTFPILFRTKFRFTNRTLLLFSSLGTAALSLLALYVKVLPLLWVVCFFVGVLKLQGTFECMSNIQLWMTPKRDFAVFFPVLHFFIMLSISASDLIAVYLCHYTTWQHMTYLMMGVMLFNAIWIFLLTRHVRIMPKMPLLAVDWLGAILWALTVMQVVFVFCYGDFYDWWVSPVICTVSGTAVFTAILALVRMMMIRHPYVDPKIFLVKNFGKFLVCAFLIEAFTATEHVLESMFFAAGPHWGEMQRVTLDYPVMGGVIVACLFALLWLKVMRFSVLKLTAIALAAFGGYSLWFYFNVSPTIGIGQLWFPLFLRGFATTTISISMLYFLESIMNFMTFFQSMALFQCLHLAVGGSVGAAIYNFLAKYFVADQISNYAGAFDATTFSMASQAQHIDGIMAALQVAAVKEIFGIVTYVAIILILLVMLWDIPLVRTLRNPPHPYWRTVGAALKTRLSRI